MRLSLQSAVLKPVGHPDEIATYQYVAMPVHVNRQTLPVSVDTAHHPRKRVVGRNAFTSRC